MNIHVYLYHNHEVKQFCSSSSHYRSCVLCCLGSDIKNHWRLTRTNILYIQQSWGYEKLCSSFCSYKHTKYKMCTVHGLLIYILTLCAETQSKKVALDLDCDVHRLPAWIWRQLLVPFSHQIDQAQLDVAWSDLWSSQKLCQSRWTSLSNHTVLDLYITSD